MKRPTAEGPFPGARPYDEEDREFFFGRGPEINEVTQRVFRERVTILTGESATGKTSLLRAGVVPGFRRMRSDSQRDKSSAQVSPTLIFREWGGGKEQTAEKLIRDQLQPSIDRVREWSESDYERLTGNLQTIPRKSGVVESIEHLANVFGGLILVFDQFEEVLRAGKSLAKDLIEIIQRLLEIKGVRLLLALREEYHKDLRDLENSVGPLYRRTYFLKAMDAPTLRDALQDAADEAQVEISEEVMSRLLRWVTEVADRSQSAPADPDKDQSPEENPDLLRIQTVLREILRFCKNTQQGSKEIRIDKEVLDAYMRGRDPREIVGTALERWIDDALFPPSKGALAADASQGCEVPEPALTGLVRRIAVRLAPFMSSGGYKVAQESSDLLRNALREDLSNLLSLDDPTLWQMMTILEGGELQLELESHDWLKGKENLSGVASEKEWDSEKTLREMNKGFGETLYRLKKGNVIKPLLRIDGQEVWELVHDGFGRPFANWADQNRETWGDCAPSLVVCRGISPILIRDPLEAGTLFQHIRWLGCLVKPKSADLGFEGISFRSCDLAGTIFEGCVFKGGGFESCNLNGTLFRNCRFLAGPGGESVRFRDCQPNSLGFIGSRLGPTRFDSCRLSQLTFAGTVLTGQLRFSNCDLDLASFVQLKSDDGGGFIFKNDCRGQYCAWDESFEPLKNDEFDFEHSGLLKGR